MSSTASRRFDLRGEAPTVRKLVAAGRIGLLGVAVVAVGAVAYLSWRYTVSSQWTVIHGVFIGGLVWAAALFVGIGFFAIAPPAEWVDVDSGGLRFGLERGAIHQQDWVGSDSNIRLYETTGVRDVISQAGPRGPPPSDGVPFRRC